MFWGDNGKSGEREERPKNMKRDFTEGNQLMKE